MLRATYQHLRKKDIYIYNGEIRVRTISYVKESTRLKQQDQSEILIVSYIVYTPFR